MLRSFKYFARIAVILRHARYCRSYTIFFVAVRTDMEATSNENEKYTAIFSAKRTSAKNTSCIVFAIAQCPVAWYFQLRISRIEVRAQLHFPRLIFRETVNNKFSFIFYVPRAFSLIRYHTSFALYFCRWNFHFYRGENEGHTRGSGVNGDYKVMTKNA